MKITPLSATELKRNTAEIVKIVNLVAFGGGFTYAAALLQWHLEAPKLGLKERGERKVAKILHRSAT